MKEYFKSSIQGIPNNFSPSIESLRGIASFSVYIGHFYLVVWASLLHFPPNQKFFLTLINGIFDPQPAVLLFFTISGVALGRLLKKEPIYNLTSFVAYLCRRAFRLIPLMWATTFLAFLCVYSTCGASFSLLYHTLMLKDISLNVPLWSLHVELYCSIFFPFIFLIFEAGGMFLNLILFTTLTILSIKWQDPIFLQFLVFFHAGLIVDKINLKINKSIAPVYVYLGLVLSILVFLYAPEFSFGVRNWGFGHWQSWVFPEIIACSLIVFFVLNQSNFLLGPIIRYFGKISFSLYLIHFPIMLFLLTFFPISGNFMKSLYFFVGDFAITLLLATLFYYWIELPANHFGKHLSKYVLYWAKQEGTIFMSFFPRKDLN